MPEGSKLQRGARYKGEYPELPTKTGYIVQYLFEIGPAVSNGNGLAITPWSEVRAWCDLTGITLERYEVDTIRELSSAYVDQYYKAQKRECISPWREHPMTKEEVGKGLKAILTQAKGRPHGLRKTRIKGR